MDSWAQFTEVRFMNEVENNFKDILKTFRWSVFGSDERMDRSKICFCCSKDTSTSQNLPLKISLFLAHNSSLTHSLVCTHTHTYTHTQVCTHKHKRVRTHTSMHSWNRSPEVSRTLVEPVLKSATITWSKKHQRHHHQRQQQQQQQQSHHQPSWEGKEKRHH